MFKKKCKEEKVIRDMTVKEWNTYVENTYTPKYVTVCGEKIALENATTENVVKIMLEKGKKIFC